MTVVRTSTSAYSTAAKPSCTEPLAPEPVRGYSPPTLSSNPLTVMRPTAATQGAIDMARKCILTGKRPNVANKVSHSNIKTKKRQLPNLQRKRIWWAEGERFVTLRISTRAMRTIDKKGLAAFAAEQGLDLSRF